MYKLHIIALITAMSMTCSAAKSTSIPTGGITISGITFPEKIGYNKKVLYLNGAGTRTKFFMNIYVAGLYVSKKTKDAATIINANESMSMRITIISSMLTGETMENAIREGFERSMNGDVSEIKEQIDQVCKAFTSSSTKVGDQYDLNFTPGIGFSTTKNGKSYTSSEFGKFSNGKAQDGNLAFSPGKNNIFKKAIFGIWLGDDPVDDGLKASLLGIEDE